MDKAVRAPGRLSERPDAGTLLVLLFQLGCELVPSHTGDPAALFQVGHLERLSSDGRRAGHGPCGNDRPR